MCRIRPAGEPPSPRAAHAAAAVGTMVVFQVLKKKIGELGFLVWEFGDAGFWMVK